MVRTVNLESGRPTVEEARRRLLNAIRQAEDSPARLLKGVHGWGSTGSPASIKHAIHRSLRLRVKERRVRSFVPGERFSSDTEEGRDLLRRYPQLRRDRELNRANPGITLVELSPGAAPRK